MTPSLWESPYAQEAEQRWGHTDAYKESARRTKKYTAADWERFKLESEANTLKLAELMRAGVPADSEDTLAAVEAARLLICNWFYDCSREMHANLGQMYVSDVRFTETYDKVAPGLAQYICDATAANALHKE